MLVTKYKMRFTKLPCYSTLFIPTKTEKIKRFIDGLNFDIRFGRIGETVRGATLAQTVQIASSMECICM